MTVYTSGYFLTLSNKIMWCPRERTVTISTQLKCYLPMADKHKSWGSRTQQCPICLVLSLCTRINFSLFVLTLGSELFQHLTTDELWGDVCRGRQPLQFHSSLLLLTRNTNCPGMFINFYVKWKIVRL